MKLRHLCQIHSGYTNRKGLDPAFGGGLLVLQMRDLVSEVATPDLKQRYDLGGVSERYLVSAGDVVFRSRGEPSTATAIDDTLPEPLVVIGPLVIIRPNKAKLLPDYLAWAINHPNAQRQLRMDAQGTSIRMVPMSALEKLDIPVPTLQSQQRIVELATLARREGALLRQLAERREALANTLLIEAAKAAELKEIA